MTSDEAVPIILKMLYERFFSEEDRATDIEALREAIGLPTDESKRLLDELEHIGLIHTAGTGRTYFITREGVLAVEQVSLADSAMIQRNRIAREQILRILEQKFREKGIEYYPSINEIAAMTGLSALLVRSSIWYSDLREQVQYDAFDSQGFRISPYGLKVFRALQTKSILIDEFARIEQLSAHERGRKLQTFLADVLSNYGWSLLRAVKTTHEEVDFIVYQDREYYLIECEWRNEPSDPNFITEIYGKIDSRVGINGLAFSMSGFTKGAVKRAELHAPKKVILLFGERDLRGIISGDESFADLLDEKYRELVTYRRVTYR